MTFLISLPILALAVSTTHMVPEGWPINHLGFISVVAPVTAASILTYREKGLEGVKRLLRRSFDHGRIIGKEQYAVILLILPMICVSSQLLMSLLGAQFPEKPVSIMSILVAFPLFMLFAVCEEVGWQGYSYDLLEERWGAYGASVVLGTIMAMWHLPLFILQRPPGGLTWVAGQSLNIVVTRVLIVWVFNDAGRSVFSAVLLHAIYNACTMFLPFYGTPLGPLYAAVVTAVVITFSLSVRSLHGTASPKTGPKLVWVEFMNNNLANALTGLRASLTPFIFAYIISSRSWLGLALYLVALCSDVVDGRVARKFGASSPMGAFYDVCADFLLVFSGVLGCVASGLLDTWVLGVVVLSFLQFIHGFKVRVVYDPFGRMFGVLSLLVAPLALLLSSAYVLVVEYSILFFGGCSFLARRLYLVYRGDMLDGDAVPGKGAGVASTFDD